MTAYVMFLSRDQHRSAQRTATLTLLELPNVIALLAQVALGADPEATLHLATNLHDLLKELGRPQLLVWVSEIHNIAAARLGATWSHARFEAMRGRIDQELARGLVREALAGAHKLLEQARTAGGHAYPEADYDLAGACFLLGRVLKIAGGSQRALPYLEEAQQRFEVVEEAAPGCGAARMTSVCLADRGDCLRNLGRLDAAATAYEESIHRSEQQKGERQVAVSKAQLGTVRLLQRRYQDALDAYTDARDLFTRLGEPNSVAVAWHQIGMLHRHAGQPGEAEDAYRKSLALRVQLSDVHGQAGTLNDLGNLYDSLGWFEEAASQYRRSADDFVTLGDARLEGTVRSNLADTLCKLGRWDEARKEVERAIECKQPFGHVAQPWNTWNILARIETGAGRTDLAAQAKIRARECYLAYRREGGENHYRDGRIALAVTEPLLTGDVVGTVAELDRELTGSSITDDLRSFVMTLRAIATGSRDRGLAEAAELDHTMAAEVLLLIDKLEAAAAGAA